MWQWHSLKEVQGTLDSEISRAIVSLAFPRPAHSADPLVLSDIQVLSYVLFTTCLTMWDKVCYYYFSISHDVKMMNKLWLSEYPYIKC
jgi:hypothetical protein